MELCHFEKQNIFISEDNSEFLKFLKIRFMLPPLSFI